MKSRVKMKHVSIVGLMSPGWVRTHSEFCWTRGLGLGLWPTGLGLGLWSNGLGLGLWSNGLGLTPDGLGLWPDGLGWWTRTLAWWTRTRTLALWTRTHCRTHESGLTPTLTWSISKMSQTWPKRYTKMSQTWPNKMLHQKKLKEILTIEFHTKYMKLFVNMLSVICVLLNTKFHNTSENFYFEVIWSRTIVSCKVTNVANRYMDFFLDLDEEFNFQRPVCLDSNRKHYNQSKTCW